MESPLVVLDLIVVIPDGTCRSETLTGMTANPVEDVKESECKLVCKVAKRARSKMKSALTRLATTVAK